MIHIFFVVTGVPFYVFDGRLALSGAQPKEVFLQALDRLQQPEASARRKGADTP